HNDALLESFKESSHEKRIMATAPLSQTVQVVITYRRFATALYVSHINAMRNFEMAFQRSGLKVQFTQGFNPKPKLEFVNPLSIGIGGEEEVLLAELIDEENLDEEKVRSELQHSLNEGYTVRDVLFLRGTKKQTLAKHLKGSCYHINTKGVEPYTEKLESYLGIGDASLEVSRCEEPYHYVVRLAGERNLIKLLFGAETDKFMIASKLSIKREKLFAGSWETGYIEYLQSIE
ncbi:MAG: TIGR03936 family radical SAM-associated protein, partial [Sphaerochaetaceae bacterium]